MRTVVLSFTGADALAGDIAVHLDSDHREIAFHRFPDGESLVTLPDIPDPCDVVLVATLRDPDPVALPLRFAAATARDMGGRRIGLVAPYLAYMRQDRRFAPGQAINARLFAKFVEESFDWIVTVDPHLHRIPTLKRLFTIPAARVRSAPLIAEWIAAEVPDAVILGPDSESQQWVAEVARMVGRPHEVLTKVRTGDLQVDISVPNSQELLWGTPVVLDDIASSGATMTRAIERLRAAGTAPPVCVIIHAVFAGTAFQDIMAAGATRIVTTDTIPHHSNAVSVAACLAKSAGLFVRPQIQTETT